MSPLGSSPGVIRFGDFDVDVRSGELRKHGLRIKLQVQPFQVLQILLEHPGEVVTREELQKRIWPADTFVDFNHGLNNAVKKLRDALSDAVDEPRFIQTLSKRGYRFIGSVDEAANEVDFPSKFEMAEIAKPIAALPRRQRIGRIALAAIVVLALGALVVGLRLSALKRGTSRRIRHTSTGSSPTSASYPLPLIYRPLVPDTAEIGRPAFTLSVNGSGFAPSSVVNWNGQERSTTFVNSSQLQASILASDVAKAGTAVVTVVTPGQDGRESNEVFFSLGGSAYTVNLKRADISVGLQPDSVAVGDFNGDGKLDLVVSSFGSNNVSVLLGNGDGTFRAAANYNVGKNPSSVAVADVNGDGNLDLVVANQNCKGAGNPPCEAATVSILLGNGDGTFQQHKDFPAGQNINWVVVGDFNGDGKLDLAVVNGGASVDGSAVLILLGNGDGTFHASARYPMGANGVSAAAADLNGDGKLDLAVVDNMGWVSVFLGNGDGTFQARADYYTSGSFPWGSIAVGDFSGSGTVDIAVANSGSNSVTILFGYGGSVTSFV